MVAVHWVKVVAVEASASGSLDVHMGIVVRLPPVGCCAIELVCSRKDLLVISALGDHEFLLNPLEPIFYIHGVFGL
jgi:hypothetical protein